MLAALLLSIGLLTSPTGPSLVGLGRSAPARQWYTAPVRDTAFVPSRHRRVVFQFDQRYSLVGGQLAGINGFKLGIEWRSRLRTGIGLYGLAPGVGVPAPADAPTTSTAELRLNYVAAYGEYVLAGNPRWEVSVPMQVGWGRYYYQYAIPEGRNTRSPRDRIWLLEPSMAGHYRVFRWIGIGAGVGWRQAFAVKSRYRHELDGPVFYLRGKLFLGDLVKVVRGRQKLFTQRGLRKRDWVVPDPLDDDSEED